MNFVDAEQFSREGLHVGRVKVWEDPREPGQFPLPANAILSELCPAFDPEKEALILVDGAFSETHTPAAVCVPYVKRSFFNRETGEKVEVLDHPQFFPDPEKFSDSEPVEILEKRKEQEERAALLAKIANLHRRAFDLMALSMATPEEAEAIKRLSALDEVSK
jgi:hypothetical protein